MRHCGAIILAAGSGSRMKTNIPKQFLELKGTPLFLHSVREFAKIADEIVLVTGEQSLDYCKEILKKEMLPVPFRVIAGGKERYHSSMAGLAYAAEWEYVMIHDAARACISVDVIQASLEAAICYGSGVAAVLAKDTIKIADENGFVKETPKRSALRVIQTPQTFRSEWIREAYDNLKKMKKESDVPITDDAMVLETYGKKRVFLSEGSYENIKITTPEDLLFCELILQRR